MSKMFQVTVDIRHKSQELFEFYLEILTQGTRVPMVMSG